MAVQSSDAKVIVAHMFPPTLTGAFSGSRSSAEKLIFEKAKQELGDEFYVFHDIEWDDPSLGDTKTSGQIDFVIAHPEHGLICLEVKGGRCSYRSTTRTWETVDRDDIRIEIADPFDQARTAARVLVRLLLKRPECQHFYIPACSIAAFPDCTLPHEKAIRADIQEWQVLDQEDLFDFGGSMDSILDKAFAGNSLRRDHGVRIIQGLKGLFGGSDVEGHISVGSRIRTAEERLIALTEQQLQILDALRLHERLLVQGCAGSGKTTLAVHKARCLAEEGKNVLLACYNIPLGRHLEAECADCKRICAGPLLELCVSWLRESGIDVGTEPDNQWWSNVLPTLMVSHLDELAMRFDAIVVDEGQDFGEAHWTLIELLLEDPEKGGLYVFSDRGQNIYSGWDKYPMLPAPVMLDRNVRNTDQVFGIVKPLCPHDIAMHSSGVSGPAPRLIEYTGDQAMHAAIEGTLALLIRESVAISDIVLLGTKAQARTTLKHGEKIGPFRLVPERTEARDLLSMTVHRFKGLESRAVIVCELDDVKRVEELLYVGATRSSGILIVLAEGEAFQVLSKLQFRSEGRAG